MKCFAILLVVIFAGLYPSLPASCEDDPPPDPVEEEGLDDSEGVREETPEELARPVIVIEDFRKNDLVELSLDDDKAIIIVSSKMGIGTATLELKEGEWPSTIVVKLRLSTGEALKGLEGFFAIGEKLGAKSSLGNPHKPSCCKINDAGFIDENSPVGELDMKIARLKDCTEVTIPMAMLGEDSKTLKLRWIDFYRN